MTTATLTESDCQERSPAMQRRVDRVMVAHLIAECLVEGIPCDLTVSLNVERGAVEETLEMLSNPWTSSDAEKLHAFVVRDVHVQGRRKGESIELEHGEIMHTVVNITTGTMTHGVFTTNPATAFAIVGERQFTPA
jgi:hypothetical protein